MSNKELIIKIEKGLLKAKNGLIKNMMRTNEVVCLLDDPDSYSLLVDITSWYNSTLRKAIVKFEERLEEELGEE